MGRKLVKRVLIEKNLDKKPRKGHVAIIIAQHLLLWSSGYVIASTAYLIHTEAITKDLIPAAVILISTVGLAEMVSPAIKQLLITPGLRKLAFYLHMQRSGLALDKTSRQKLSDIPSMSPIIGKECFAVHRNRLGRGIGRRDHLHRRQAPYLSHV